jgi:hypothetical protein
MDQAQENVKKRVILESSFVMTAESTNKVFTHTPQEIAEQLTFIEWNFFSKIVVIIL